MSWDISAFKSKIEDKLLTQEKEIVRLDTFTIQIGKDNQTLQILVAEIKTKLNNIETILIDFKKELKDK